MTGPSEIALRSPAKLNLFLHITGRRADGYHTLQTLFQLLDFGDDMRFVARDDGQVVLHNPIEGLSDNQHLAVRAALALQAHTQPVQGVDIHIHKRIPMGGGLGGGSSNAATTLLALNRLWQLNLSTEQLAQIGLPLGADVPVFVHGQTAFAEGVGELLQPCPQPDRWFVVLTPAVSVSTAAVFNHPALTRQHAIVTIRALERPGWWNNTNNDCECVVRNAYPEVDRALSVLINAQQKQQQINAPARMTGTGSSVFAWVSNEAEAQQLLQACQHECAGFIARGLNRSPALNA